MRDIAIMRCGPMIRAFLAVLATAVLPAPGLAAAPLDARVVQSGHSLTDPIRDPLRRMLQEMGVRNPVVELSTIPGSPMDWRWEHNSGPPGKDARHDIADFDVLVLTERAPLSTGTLLWHNSEDEAAKWALHAWTHGNGGKGAATVIYATWVPVNSGPDNPDKGGDEEAHLTFAERMPLELARWEAITDRVNASLPEGAPPAPLIPGPLVMKAMADAVAEGRVPGISKMSDLFLDEIHITENGAYLIALAHYAVIYGRDPRELPDRIGRRGQEELAAFMQNLVAEVLEGYPRSRPNAR